MDPAGAYQRALSAQNLPITQNSINSLGFESASRPIPRNRMTPKQRRGYDACDNQSKVSLTYLKSKVRPIFKKDRQEIVSTIILSNDQSTVNRDKMAFQDVIFQPISKGNAPSQEKALARVPVLIEALRNKNAKESEGIFRLSGIYNADITVNKLIDEKREISETDIDVLATALKKTMKEISFPEAFVTETSKESALNSPNKNNVIQLIESLPDTYRELLKNLSSFLKEIADNSDSNKMTISNLTIVFAPNLPFSAKTFQLLIESSNG